jgi:serine/threonine protein kinase
MQATLKAGLRVSEYVLEEPLGSGTFGEVWRARHHVWSSEVVAVKLPTEPQYVRYLQREGIVVHGLRHENIVRVLGLDPYADTPYLVMELVDGPSLRQVIDAHRQGLPLGVVEHVLRGVLNGLVVAHEAGVLHRDMKPGNVLLHLTGRPATELRAADVKLSDFGLGVSTGDTLRSLAQSASLARDDQLVGTLAYMAPEVRDGAQAPDARSDLYAVGVMLFEMLTGERPAGAELPSTVRPEAGPLDEVFRRLYARHERRYESARAVLADLPTSGGGGVPRARPAPGFVRQCPGCRRTPEPGDQFCTHCGMQLVDRVRRCDACGAFPAPEDRFCIFCGAALPGPSE